jgi:hypothetical protein
MANVGDLFINVRAKTSGLTKGLRSARRSLANFARSGTGIIAGIGAAFGIFKTFDFMMGSLIGHSKEFRESWAQLQTSINEAGQEFAMQFGPQLAQGISDLSKWVSESQALRDVFAGIGPLFTDIIIPAISAAYQAMQPFANALADIISEMTGVNEEMRKAGQAITPGELRALSIPRSGPAAEARALGAQKATSRDYLNAEMLKYQKRIAERVEIPK